MSDVESEEELLQQDIDANVEKIDRVKTISLFPYQVPHFKRINEILQHEIGYLDVSNFGCGKTILALAVAATYKMGVMVFGPKTVLINWKNQCKLYGIHLYTAMTYASLRGTVKSGVKHDLLTRDKDEYFPTSTLESCAKIGVLIIFDECHALKNENSQLEAAHTLVREAVRLAKKNFNVRIACLSSTPCDKKENVTSLFKILGILNSSKLYKYDRSNKTYVLTGLEEAINKCKKYDPDTTFHATCRTVNKTTAKLICHDLYSRILKKYLSSGMPEPPLDIRKNIKNIFALMSAEDTERLKKGAMLFSSATSYKHETSEVDLSKTNWGDVVRSRREIDSAKVNTMVRLSIEKLEKNPNNKVVLYYSYKRDMIRAAELLKKYNPLILNGSVIKNEDREILINKFQRFDNKYRVFISNPRVGGVGIDLDDKHGDFKRYMFIAPSYFFIDQYQATGRIRRQTTKSKTYVRFVYGREAQFESRLLTSIAEKSKTVRDLIDGNSELTLPGEYDEDIELTPEEKEKLKREEDE